MLTSQVARQQSQNRPDVLHVSEAYGGGVQTAISRYIENSPGFRHELVVRTRQAHDVGEIPDVEITRLEGSMAKFISSARRVIRAKQPRVVHLHSSFAGALRAFSFPGVKVVYTPHSYSFLRSDISPLVRAGYLGTEYLLSRGPHTIAAISPHEAATAARLVSGRAAVTYLPNVAGDVSRSVSPGRPEKSARTRVVTVGRISAQKDPSFLAQVVERVDDPSVDWTWIGDGEAPLKQRLVDAGVTVTGWLPNSEALERMAQADLYFHPARWEGAPMTLLEAVSLGTPVLTRAIATLDGLGFASAGSDAEDAARSVLRFAHDANYRASVQQTAARSHDIHSSSVQSRALSHLYGVSLEEAA
ncbi:glycosyltransferase [Prescottella agglutinans]|uniref:Glycosyltransferase n=1 Tax=Prescottella agglutinans TaxID=1644129 RepID=A0A3S3ANY3_9NOCA|nr:glycosyltransferase family 4 protein [Prescottella agglutinans]RVW09327.1 glycosyltransferase [Prescottella agglutinans]